MTDPQREHERYMQSMTHFSDWLKHVTTLSTGTILVMLAIIKTGDPAPPLPWSAKIAAISLVFATVAALVGMLAIGGAIRTGGNVSETETRFFVCATMAAMALFLVGVAAAAIALATH